MDRLNEVLCYRRSTDTTLIVGKDIYAYITASLPAVVLQTGGKIVYKGLEVRLDKSKEAGYVEIS